MDIKHYLCKQFKDYLLQDSQEIAKKYLYHLNQVGDVQVYKLIPKRQEVKAENNGLQT